MQGALWEDILYSERLTAFCVCVCPTRIRILEQTMDRQKLIRMIDRSDRIYLEDREHRSTDS